MRIFVRNFQTLKIKLLIKSFGGNFKKKHAMHHQEIRFLYQQRFDNYWAFKRRFFSTRQCCFFEYVICFTEPSPKSLSANFSDKSHDRYLQMQHTCVAKNSSSCSLTISTLAAFIISKRKEKNWHSHRHEVLRLRRAYTKKPLKSDKLRYK